MLKYEILNTEQRNSKQKNTMLGLYSDSHIPCKLGVQVPETTKSSAKTGAPSKSIPERNGVLSSFKPATTGSQKYGENLKINQKIMN